VHQLLGYSHTKSIPGSFNITAWCTYKTYVCTITSITRVSPVARVLLQPRRASRLLITWLHGLYVNLAVHREYLSPDRSGSSSTTLRDRVHRLPTSCGSLCGSSSTTSPVSRVRVPWHVARLDTWLVITHFAYDVRSGASAHRAARRTARHRLLCLCRASG
jgi:hypothetical protein